MTWVLLEDAKTLVGELVNRLRELAIMILKSGTAIASQRVAASRLEILVGLPGKVIEPASSDILFDSLVPLIGNILLEPCGKLGKLLRRELLNRQFKFYRGHTITLRQTVNTRNISCLTTKPQRPGPRDAWIATAARWPGSLQRRLGHIVTFLRCGRVC